MLIDDWWLTPTGAFEMNSSEHASFAIAFMLDMPKDSRVPNHWTIRGIPQEQLVSALERGVDPKIVEFLADKKNDSRLFVMREFGWIRVARNAWNLWHFDKETADVARDNVGYWKAQYKMTPHEMLDVYEFKTNCEYTISAQKLLDGGNPQILKKLATGGLTCETTDEIQPQYSTAKYSELERRALYKKSGDNPRRRSRK